MTVLVSDIFEKPLFHKVVERRILGMMESLMTDLLTVA